MTDLVIGDRSGRPVRYAILYGIDTRATAEVTERLGPAAILARAGAPSAHARPTRRSASRAAHPAPAAPSALR